MTYDELQSGLRRWLQAEVDHLGSQKEFCRRTGVPASAVSDIIAGRTGLGLRRLHQICSGLEVGMHTVLINIVWRTK